MCLQICACVHGACAGQEQLWEGSPPPLRGFWRLNFDVRLTQQAHTFPLSHLASFYVDF